MGLLVWPPATPLTISWPGLLQLQDAKEVVTELSAEYEACEHADYIERSRLA